MLAFMAPPLPLLPVPAPALPRSLKRPRGLWKQRRLEAVQAPRSPWPLKETPSHDWRAHRLPSGSPRQSHSPTPTLVQLRSPSATSHRSLTPSGDADDDGDREKDDACSVSSASSKRRRISGHFASASELTPSPTAGSAHACESITSPSPFPSHAIVLPPPRRHPPLPVLSMSPQIISRSVSDGTSASNASSLSAKAKHRQLSLDTPTRSADYEDWENLKELFARAADRYDADEFPEAVPLLRAVIRECHRFLIDHPDPSIVYADPRPNRSSRSPEAITPTEERLHRDWDSDIDTPSVASWSSRRRTSMAVTTTSRHTELPTAFHAIFGTSLFLMGNLVSQDPSIVLPGEPDAPSTYWLAALDVFETGENLPSRTGGNGLDTTEDWRMAIVWGRTLVCLADEKVTHNMKVAREQVQASSAASGDFCYYPMGSAFPMSEPHWAPSSPFHAIAQFRPPVTRRMSLYSASAHDIMVLAMDQFSRGIFHMPHPHYSHAHNPTFVHTPGTAASGFQNSNYFSSASAPPSHYASPYVPSSDPL
ncbi:hypothetical protein V8D89_016349, partial [Ganoderma adspersum]